MPDENIQGPLVSTTDGAINFSDAGLASLAALVMDAPEPAVESAEESADEVVETVPIVTEEPKAEAPTKFKIKVDGQEEEIDLDELKSRAQMGSHFTKEMQALRERERALAPQEGLFKQLQTDPNLGKYIADYWSKPAVQVPQAPTFEDPIDQLRWEAKQDAVKEVEERYIKPLQAQQAQMAHKQSMDRVQAAVMSDTMYKDVQGKILEYIQALPPSIGQPLFNQLDNDPKAYLDMYESVRSKLTPVTNKTETPIPKTVPKEDHAPLLESSGSAPPESQVVEQRSKIDKAKAKALRSGSTNDLAELLKSGGFLKHMI
jgi:hypothetical protein